MGEWKRTFRLLMDEILSSGLYNAASEIRCSILQENNYLNASDRHYIVDESIYPSSSIDSTHRKIIGSDLNLNKNMNIHLPTKMRIIYIGRPHEYERPTLLHMKQYAELDQANTKYFYVHTKGIRWYGTPNELNVIDWIKLLIYWNIEHWCNAVDILNKYDTYGCNYNCKEYPAHYSGNFFWTTAHHLKILPDEIGPEYNDPEFWLCSRGWFNGKPNAYNAFSSSYEGFGHYSNRFLENNYRI